MPQLLGLSYQVILLLKEKNIIITGKLSARSRVCGQVTPFNAVHAIRLAPVSALRHTVWNAVVLGIYGGSFYVTVGWVPVWCVLQTATIL